MSDEHKAVFLSYASQDADAAKRICDALRQSGVEVWFDQSELVGGDAWDAKIRQQILACSLFIPVLSATTQARREAYFRLEWKLADERTHLMAEGTPFLLPVTIDQTSDRGALVPKSFLSVQWTKLPGGEPTPAFLSRVTKLLAEETPPPVNESDVPVMEQSVRRRRTNRPAWMRIVLPLGGLAIGLIYAVWGAWTPEAPQGPATPPIAVVPTANASDSQRIVAQVRALFENPNYTRDDLALAEDLCKQALQRDASDAEIWAVYAQLSGEFIGGGTDLSPERREAARMQAERAVKLAPDSREARFAKASVLRRLGGSASAEAEKILRDMFAQTPDDPRVIIALAKAVWGNIGAERNIERAREPLALYDRAATFPATRAQALRERGWLLRTIGRTAEAETAIDASLALQASKSASTLKVHLALERGDLEAARRSLAVLPEDVLRGDQGAALAATVWWQSRNPSRCLEVLGSITRDYLSSNLFAGPTDFLRGQAYQLDGKKQAARNAWQAALQVVDKRLAIQSRDSEDLYRRAHLLALMDEREAAATALRLYEEVEGIAPGEIFESAIVHVLIDPPDHSIPMLEKLLKATLWPLSEGQLRVNPVFDSLRGDPRFEALLKKPENQMTEDGGQKTAPAADPKSIAVLPFANLSPDPENAFFCDGVHEDVLTNLANIGDVRVVSRTSVMQYRGTTKTMRQIGDELGVAYLLEGSVRRAGNKVRVTAQFIRAGSDEHVWAKQYDRDLTDIFAIQSELAREITTALQAVLTPQEKSRLERPITSNLRAYELFLQARRLFEAWNIPPDRQAQIVALLEEAVALDPNFALAWRYLSEAHGFTYFWDFDRSESRLAQAREAIDTATRLAPDDPDVLLGQGQFYYLAFRDWARARAQYERVVHMLPNNLNALRLLSNVTRREGRWVEAVELLRKAQSLEPRNTYLLHMLEGTLIPMRRYEEAIAARRELALLEPDSTTAAYDLARLAFLAHGSSTGSDAWIAQLPSTEDADAEVRQRRMEWALWRGDAAEIVRIHGNTPAASELVTNDDVITVALALQVAGREPQSRALLTDLRTRLETRLETEKENAKLWAELGLVRAFLGNPQAARDAADQAVKLRPVSADASSGPDLLTTRAIVLAWTGEPDLAIRELAGLLRTPADDAINVHVLRESLQWAPLRDRPDFQALLDDPANNVPLF